MDENSVSDRMQKILELTKKDLSTIRTGRATTALIEDLAVTVYGGQEKMKIMELAAVSVPDPQTLLISPWDKSITGEIRQGILAANIGLNPSIDGEVIRIVLAPLTTEDREKYVKLLSTKIENGRVMIRQVRGDAMHEIKKAYEAKEISEDEKFSYEKKLQEITDKFIHNIEEIGKLKEEEILRI